MLTFIQQIIASRVIRPAMKVGHFLVPRARTQRHIGGDTFHAAELAQKFRRLIFKFRRIDFGVFDRFTVEIDLVVVKSVDPVFLTVDSHQIHVQQCHATFRVEFSAGKFHFVREGFLVLEVACARKHDECLGETDLFVDQVEQLFEVFV